MNGKAQDTEVTCETDTDLRISDLILALCLHIEHHRAIIVTRLVVVVAARLLLPPPPLLLLLLLLP